MIEISKHSGLKFNFILLALFIMLIEVIEYDYFIYVHGTQF
jgi:hypothetical protein